MSAAANTLTGQAGMPRQRLFGRGNDADNEFSGIFGLTFGNHKSRRAKIKEAREALSRRFPGLGIKSGTAGEGAEGAKKDAEQSNGRDQAIVEPAVLAGMSGNPKLIKMVEDAISGFMNREEDSNLMRIPGAHVQRSVAISITAVRYSEMHLSDSTGEAVAGVDLKTSFHGKLRELVQQFFAGDKTGAGRPERNRDVTADAGDDKIFEMDKSHSPWRSMGTEMWSLDFFYSPSFMSGLAENPAGDSHSREHSGMSGAAAFTGQILPSAILRSGAGVDSSGAFPQTSLNDILGKYGLEAGSFRSTRDGVFVGIRERRNLLSELMELYEEKKSQFQDAVGMSGFLKKGKQTAV